MVKKLTYFVLKGDLSFAKKLMCMLLVTTLLVFSVLPVYDYDDKTSLNGYELSIQRFVGKISSKNEIEVAEDILKSIDLSEEYISKMPEKKNLKYIMLKKFIIFLNTVKSMKVVRKLY